MNAGLFGFLMIAVVAISILIYTETPAGKKWIKDM